MENCPKEKSPSEIGNCTLKVWKFMWIVKGLQQFKKETEIMTVISCCSNQAQI